jgi:hypothetical protein
MLNLALAVFFDGNSKYVYMGQEFQRLHPTEKTRLENISIFSYNVNIFLE